MIVINAARPDAPLFNFMVQMFALRWPTSISNEIRYVMRVMQYSVHAHSSIPAPIKTEFPKPASLSFFDVSEKSSLQCFNRPLRSAFKTSLGAALPGQFNGTNRTPLVLAWAINLSPSFVVIQIIRHFFYYHTELLYRNVCRWLLT